MTKQKKNILHSPLIVTAMLAWLLLPASLYAGVKDESLHFLTTEAGVGYSALLHSSDLGKSSGLAGGKLQLGYEWNYRKLLVHTGLEFALLSDKADVNPFTMTSDYTYGLPAGQKMTQHFAFSSYTSSPIMGQVNIPVQVGAVFAKRYYFLAGARIGLPVLRPAQVRSTVTTSLTDDALIGELNGVHVHDAYTSDEKASLQWPAATVNAQLSAEVGLVLNSFWEKPEPAKKTKGRSAANNRSSKQAKKPVLFRVALFADYGITSCLASTEQKPLAEVAEPRQIAFNDYFAASGAKVNSLLVGAKFAVLFQLNDPKPKKTKPMPSYFDIYIADAETAQPVPASLKIYDQAKKRSVVKEAKKGHLRHRAKPGAYTFTATNDRYFPFTTEATLAQEGITDTLRFAMQPKPVPVDTPVIDIPIEVGTTVVLHNLFFATGKTVILPESELALDELAAFMQEHGEVTVRITGHTDDVGSERSNQILSEGRANAVRSELLKRGVAPARIEADGKGETQPIADNKTEEGRAKNRRVEITIISTGSEQIQQLRD
ncbi:MAG: OmpA family protein [Paludibacteraceae bacterium]|nr:OmpA family protein [Paludibacteraceae bacterium]